ncbi:flagellar basal-body MS-ring/collar protein FliF [Dongshaea marina]|uniref:flagellar basal-body MS-ring/collar protein FliF n=1 Tax=Dongshaea marina TaxID=2047966 RepID=UPI000D3E8B59|nr:flagellar basal-body MS-ring/collar protein FliF [Dongshaea marina]
MAKRLVQQLLSGEGKLRGVPLDWLRQARVQLGIMILTSALVALLLVIWLWSQSVSYVPLYGAHQPVSESQILSVLDKTGIGYRIDPQTGRVLVDSSMLARARIKLAAAGVKAKMPQGLEILNKSQEIGATQFVEGIRYRHALEGELARSIMSLQPVSYAIVHLGIPRENQFVGRADGHPKAAVLVELKGGESLNPEQVEAIINLVSGAVPDLKAQNVSVEDQFGHVLSAGLNHSGQVMGQANSKLGYVASLQQRYIEQISQILRPVLGANNFQVQVDASVNFDALEQMSEQYEPNKKEISSEYIELDQSVDGARAIGVPGSLSNRPARTSKQSDNTGGNRHTQTKRQYALGRTVSKLSREPGEVSRLSVAVLVNSQALGSPANPKEKRAVDAKDLKKLRQLVSSSVGLDPKRGDALTIEALPFQHQAPLAFQDHSRWWQDPMLIYYLKYGIAGLLALVLLVILGGPLARAMLGQRRVMEQALPAGVDPARPGDSTMDSYGASAQTVASQGPRFSELAPLDNSLDGRLRQLKGLAEDDPARAAQVIRQWMKENGQ